MLRLAQVIDQEGNSCMGDQATPIEGREVVTFERSYPGTVFYVRLVRADLALIADGHPLADDLILLASELSANAVMHSKSGQLGGEFTVRARLYPGDYTWVEIVDQGGPWNGRELGDDRPHGLDIVAKLAGGDNWGIDGDERCRVAWFRLDWSSES
jgi:hypothetical protein